MADRKKVILPVKGYEGYYSKGIMLVMQKGENKLWRKYQR